MDLFNELKLAIYESGFDDETTQSLVSDLEVAYEYGTAQEFAEHTDSLLDILEEAAMVDDTDYDIYALEGARFDAIKGRIAGIPGAIKGVPGNVKAGAGNVVQSMRDQGAVNVGATAASLGAGAGGAVAAIRKYNKVAAERQALVDEISGLSAELSRALTPGKQRQIQSKIDATQAKIKKMDKTLIALRAATVAAPVAGVGGAVALQKYKPLRKKTV